LDAISASERVAPRIFWRMSKPANGSNIYTGVVRYAPAQTQRLHRDEKSKISVLLRGKLSEDSAWASTRLAAGDILIKSREVAHEDCFGPSGATVLRNPA
jgi:hypothetical protein